MNSRLSQIFIVFGALVAFLPVLGVNYLLDNYIRESESLYVFSDVEALTDETQDAVYSGISAIRQILNDSPSLCTQTFQKNAQKQLRANIYLKQVLVENFDLVQYCDAYDSEISYSVLSENLPIPGNSEVISLVRFVDEHEVTLKVTRGIGNKRTISAFVHLPSSHNAGLPREFKDAALLRLELTNGAEILSIGDPELADSAINNKDYIHSYIVADALPLKLVVVFPFSLLRAPYAALELAITLVAAIMGAAFLLLAFNYVRQARLPAFDLERAIARGELKPYYQPVMDISTGRLAGCEVLIRWEKKTGEVLSPGVFIEYAEASGLAIPMTIRLMEQVCEDLDDLCAENPDLKVAINLFEGHFRDTSIVEDVQTIFDESSISYRQLVFEITERRPIQGDPSTTAVIGGLHALGCRLAMDDAGTGHSSLEYIQTLGVDIIKIDQIFVGMIEDDTENVPIVDGLINMAKDMNLDVVAEGIETEAQAVYLRKRGVKQAQGYLFAPALKCEAYLELAAALGAQPARPSKQLEADDEDDAFAEDFDPSEEMDESDVPGADTDDEAA